MAIATLAQLNSALPGQRPLFFKVLSSSGAGRIYSAWAIGSIPAAGVAPSSGMAGDIPTKATLGALPFVNPASGNLYLGRASCYLASPLSSNTQGYVFLYDRLWHQSGIVVTTTGSQTINSVALTRPNSNGDDVEAWLQIYTATGAGAAVPTISYTNQAGTAGRTGTLMTYAASAAANRIFPFSLQSGDTGVRSIQSITLGTSLTSGSVGLVMRRKIALFEMPYAIHAGGIRQDYQRDAISLGMPVIPNDACLELCYQHGLLAAIASFQGSLSLVQG